jgi:hypothetical protein
MQSKSYTTLASYPVPVVVSIVESSGTATTLWSLITAGLSVSEKERVVGAEVTGQQLDGATNRPSFTWSNTPTSTIKNTVDAGVAYTEPCTVRWLQKTYVKAVADAIATSVVKVYIRHEQ